jgi:glycosyltransferase involved in cell wall biosynthesis
MQKIISVIVPVYNVEDFLPRCLDSILKQRFVDFELILVNDGSTDTSGKICDEYAKIDERIKVIHQKNGGLSNARNSGIDIASGTYISFIDSDDWINEDMLFEMHEQASLHGADIVIAGHFVVNLDRSIEENITVKAKRVLDRITATKLILQDDVINSFAWDKLYRSKLFNNLRYPVNRVFEDTATSYKLFNHASILVQLDKAYYYYVRRQSSICLNPEFSKVIKRKNDNYLAFQERYEFTLANTEYSSIVDVCQAKAFIHGQQLIHFIIKNKLQKELYSCESIIRKISVMKISKNSYLTLFQKLEHQIMRTSISVYLLFMNIYYSFKALK